MIEVMIPHVYLHLTENSKRRGELFKRYVEGYIRHNFPKLKLVKIEGMKAICETSD